uniref:hypothetical protein n=1 Tax=Oscillatoria sp. HE19RPO TaxID=2954806 RepID=UPI0020C23A2A
LQKIKCPKNPQAEAWGYTDEARLRGLNRVLLGAIASKQGGFICWNTLPQLNIIICIICAHGIDFGDPVSVENQWLGSLWNSSKIQGNTLRIYNC